MARKYKNSLDIEPQSSSLATLDKPQDELSNPEKYDNPNNPLVKRLTNHKGCKWKPTTEQQEKNPLTQLGIYSLHEQGLSQRSIAFVSGIPHESVGNVLRDENLKETFQGSETRVSQMKKVLPAMLLSVAYLSLHTITIDEIRALNPVQRITLCAIAIDKARLLLNESTVNVSVRDLVPRIQGEIETLSKRHSELLEVLGVAA